MQIIHKDTDGEVQQLLEGADYPEQKRILFRATSIRPNSEPVKAGFVIPYEHSRDVLRALYQGTADPLLDGCPSWANRHVIRFLTRLQESPIMEHSISYQLDTIREQQDTIVEQQDIVLEQLNQTITPKTPSAFDALEILTNSFKRGVGATFGFGGRVLKTAFLVLLALTFMGGVTGGTMYVTHPEFFAFTATVVDYDPQALSDGVNTRQGEYTVECEPTFLGGFLGYEAEEVSFIDAGNSWYRAPGITEVGDLEGTILDAAQESYFAREAVVERLNAASTPTETVPVENATPPVDSPVEDSTEEPVGESPTETETPETETGE